MRRHETWIALLLLCAVGCGVDGLRGSELVLAAKAKAAEEKLNPTTELVEVLVNDDGTNSTVVKPVSLLTGIPQIDYIHDPNLPHELKGYNLTDYPFYNSVPKDIKFECDGLHDGFYASVPHKCQVYHHCLFGTRYDFLCANYTAFDQTTFICHFVSEVNCKNSPNHYKRNEALYKQAETTTPPTTRAPTTTTTTTTTTEAPPKKGGRRRRPYRRRRPVYEYYYDDEEEAYDEEYYDDDVDPPPRKANRRQQRPSGGRREDPTTTTTTTTTSTTTAAPASADAPLTRAPLSVYAPRALPKIKRPVPINEKSKYDYTTKAGAGVPAPTSNPKDSEDDEYFYDDEEYDEPQPPPSKRKESGKNGRRRNQHAERKRPLRYEDEYEDEIEEEEDERPRMRKGNNRKDDDFRPRNRGSQGKSKKGQRDDDEPIPSERPGYISSQRGGSRKRQPEGGRPERRRPDRRPAKGYDYYDEEVVEDDVSRYSDERRRPNSRSKAEKPRARPKKPTTTSTTTTSTTTSTTTTTTTQRPTPAPTPSPPASYEDEEYEEYEYEDDIILDKPKNENRKEIQPTTPAPHRFSTTGYRTQRLPSPSPTTTEQTVRRGTPTFRSRQPDYRRPPSSDETFSSQVGTPTGFKRPEEDNARVKSSEQNNRGSYNDENQRIRVPEFPSRRPVSTGNGYASEDRRQVKPETPQPTVDSKPPATRQEYPIPPAEVKPQGESQGFFIRKPFKPGNSFSSKYSDDSSPRRPDNYNLPVSGLSGPSAEDNLSYRKQQADPKLVDSEETNLRPEEKKQRVDYSVPPPQITQGPPLPSPPQTSIYRRPFVPTGPEGPRRPNEESQYRRQKPDPFAPQPEGNARRPVPSSAEGSINKEEDQSYRRSQKPSYTPTGPEAFRRPSGPDGTSKSSSSYRRTRPEKEQKKTLEELAYPSRRPVQTQEPVTEPGPNYRNPFLSARPVVEEPDYYKGNKEPALDFTAPGPSNDGSTQRPLSYDISEEYDVTLNDALQPSTLNPTVQYSRVKTRGYQSAVTHPSYRSILIPAASQNYYSKTAVADQMEYETVVLPTARFTQAQARYKTPRRPNDWSYW